MIDMNVIKTVWPMLEYKSGMIVRSTEKIISAQKENDRNWGKKLKEPNRATTAHTIGTINISSMTIKN